MRRPRHLSQEERALWDRVAERATPLDPGRPLDPQPSQPPSKSQTAIAPPSLPPFSVGQKANHARPHDVLPTIGERLSKAPVNMDAKSFAKMKRGKIAPEGRIDLHGMVMAEAHPRLQRFIMESHAMGRRLVLVITGKGKDRDDGGPIPTRRGVLRHQVPQWLALPPLNMVVMQVVPAHLRHGGDGAYYVYLRRDRK